MLARWLQRQWFERRLTPALLLLWPLLWPLQLLYILLAARARRRTLAQRLPVPVVVVGNLIVGGAGKTPVTLWLAEQLAARGWRPGIISRGYGRQDDQVVAVTPASPVSQVGDEPLLLARRSGVPVFVGRQRREAGAALLQAHPEVNLLLCDDGLQHHALARDVELVVFDRRGAGNGWRLPLGPLRESLARLRTVDAVIAHFSPQQTGKPGPDLPATTCPRFTMHLRGEQFIRLDQSAPPQVAAYFAGKKLYALAGIGHPERFFATLTGLGLHCQTRAFPDHHAYTAADLSFAADGILLMTEKDAVKCATLLPGEAWFLPVAAELPPALIELVEEKLRGRQAA